MIILMENEIKSIVNRLADEIYEYYNKKGINSIDVVWIEHASIIFVADLIRELSRRHMKICLSSIKVPKEKPKNNDYRYLYHIAVKNTHILYVDTIIDTGKTIKMLRETINLSLKNCEYCFLLKKEQTNLDFLKDENIFIGITIPDVFVTGYGLNTGCYDRELPHIKWESGLDE